MEIHGMSHRPSRRCQSLGSRLDRPSARWSRQYDQCQLSGCLPSTRFQVLRYRVSSLICLHESGTNERWSQECFGSSTIAGENKLAAEADCSNICTGRPGEKCGGSSRLSAWEYGPIAAGDTTTIPVASTTTTPATVANPSPTSSNKEWKSLGCYFDGQGGRALPNGHADEVPGGYKNMTNVGCTATCEKLGFTLAGTEYVFVSGIAIKC